MIYHIQMLPREIRSINAVVQDSVNCCGNQHSKKYINNTYHHEHGYCKRRVDLFSLTEPRPKAKCASFL